MLGSPEMPLINAAAEAQPFKEPRVSIAQLVCSPAYWTAVVTTALAALGAGVLAYPFAFMKAGLVGGGILLFTMSTFGGIALFILMRSIAYVQRTEPSVHAYGEVVRVLCGPCAGTVVEIGVIFYAMGACWSYLVLLADVIGPVVGRFSSLPDELVSQLVMAISALIGLLLCLLRKINALKWTAVIAVLAVLMLVAALVREYVKHPCKPDDCTDEEGVPGWPRGGRGVKLFPDGFGSVAAAIPLVTFALQCHIQTPSVYAEVPVSLRTPRVNVATAVGTYALLCLLYLPTGIAGYARFGGATAGDIINNFSISDDLADAVRVCIAVTALCSYPMQHFPARTTIHQIWVKWNRKRGTELPAGMSRRTEHAARRAAPRAPRPPPTPRPPAARSSSLRASAGPSSPSPSPCSPRRPTRAAEIHAEMLPRYTPRYTPRCSRDIPEVFPQEP